MKRLVSVIATKPISRWGCVRKSSMDQHLLRSVKRSFALSIPNMNEKESLVNAVGNSRSDVRSVGNDQESVENMDPVFLAKQEQFRAALLNTIGEKRNSDVKYYWACFMALSGTGAFGFELLFRLLDIPYVGAGYLAILMGYMAFRYFTTKLTGGSNIAKSMGGIEINETEQNQKKRKVYEMVRDVSNKIGLPSTPVVCWIECEEPNAFASGQSLSCACVTVTSGLVNSLNDMELKSVIGHEIGHIINGDMKTGTLLAGMVSSFGILYDIIKHWKPQNKKSSKEQQVVETVRLIITLFAMVTMFAGRLLTLAVSRHREYSADAVAGALTHPYYIRDALNKISNVHRRENLQMLPRSDSTSHLFIFNEGLSILSTHPSFTERCSNLEKMASFNVEDFRRLTKGSIMNDSRAKNTMFAIMGVYFILVAALGYYLIVVLEIKNSQELSEAIQTIFNPPTESTNTEGTKETGQSKFVTLLLQTLVGPEETKEKK